METVPFTRQILTKRQMLCIEELSCYLLFIFGIQVALATADPLAPKRHVTIHNHDYFLTVILSIEL